MASYEGACGILFVYAEDGKDWSDHLAKILKNESYEIPCNTVHWYHVDGEEAMSHPVHVLMLTPLMEPHVKHEKFSYLRNDSGTSLLLECNVNSKSLQISDWKIRETIDQSLEKQRHILHTLVDMYETSIDYNDPLGVEGTVPYDIVPMCLYPGERTIHILFSREPQGEVTIRLEGVPGRIPTMKHTTNTFVCNLPETKAGQKIISVYDEGTLSSLYSTMITVVSPEALLDNFIDNLKETLRIDTSGNYRSRHMMGLHFNPFTDRLFPKHYQRRYARNIGDIISGNRDAEYYDDRHYEMITPGMESPRLSRSSSKNREQAGMESPRLSRSSSKNREQAEMESPGLSRSSSKEREQGKRKKNNVGRFIKNLFRTSNNIDSAPNIYKERKFSRRSTNAQTQRIVSAPDLPTPSPNNGQPKAYYRARNSNYDLTKISFP